MTARNGEIGGGSDSLPVDRRKFLALPLAAVGPLCCVSPELSADEYLLEGGTLALDIRNIPALRHPGSAVGVVDPGRKLNLLVVHVERGRFAAIDRVCTHGGALCTYDGRRRTLRCTSLNHAEYDLRGALLHGRTHGNLRAYPVTRQGSRLTVVLEARV